MNRVEKRPVNSLDGSGADTFLRARNDGFRRVLEFEGDCRALLDYTTEEGQPYWAMVRWYLCRVIQDRLQGTQTCIMGPRPSLGVAVVMQFAFRSIGGLMRLAFDQPRKIVFVCSGVANIKSDGPYVNRLTDLMARCFSDQTILLEKHDALRYHRPRAYPLVRAYGGLQFAELMLRRIGKVKPEQARRLQGFFGLLRSSFSDVVSTEEWAWLERICCGTIRAERGALRLYGWLLDRLRPKVLLVEDGHYGASGHLLAAARIRGILVAEYQHGLISVNHEAYNYHPSLLARGFSRCLPDYLLTYGDYWSEATSTSARLRVIGNPHLDSLICRPRAEPAPAGSVILLSAAMDTVRYQVVLQQLVDCGYQVTFRPHPCERDKVSVVYGAFCQERGIAIDTSSDVHAAISRHEFVVGDVSTSVVEAASLHKPVFLIDCADTRNHLPAIFPRFGHAREIGSRLASRSNHGQQGMSLWADGWEQRYRAWILEVTDGNALSELAEKKSQ